MVREHSFRYAPRRSDVTLYVADFSRVVLACAILVSFAVKPQSAEDSHTLCVTDAAHSFIRNLCPDDSGDATDVLVLRFFAQLEFNPAVL